MPISLHYQPEYTTHTLAELEGMLTRVEQGGTVAWELIADARGLSLREEAETRTAPTRVDFLDASLQYRLRTTGKRQGLGKAIGLDKVASGHTITVVDATAGFGRDAFTLAHLGCEVVMIERSPLLHALLQDGMSRASSDVSGKARLDRMRLVHAESREYLAACINGEVPAPDVVYLDPMFPPRQKSAKVKKDMALLHQLLGSEGELESLLSIALKAANNRVVLKRPDGKLPADFPAPTLWIGEQPAAFAVYVNSSFSRMR